MEHREQYFSALNVISFYYNEESYKMLEWLIVRNSSFSGSWMLALYVDKAMLVLMHMTYSAPLGTFRWSQPQNFTRQHVLLAVNSSFVIVEWMANCQPIYLLWLWANVACNISFVISRVEKMSIVSLKNAVIIKILENI